MNRTAETPWMVIDLLTNETLGWYARDIDAWLAHKGQPIDVHYRPLKKKAKRKEFPYNGK